MTAPLAPPGYPDPGGANPQRYFDGTKWTDHLAPFNPPSGPGPLPPPKSQPRRPGPAKSPRPFVIMAIAGPVTSIVTYVLMQLSFDAADSGRYWFILVFQIVGFVLFLVWLASNVATTVGIIGAIVRSVRQH
jgi:Protein of unknown function (DUF2510)